MADSTNTTPIDKMTERQQRDASIAALPKVGHATPAAPATPVTGGVSIDQMTPGQSRDAAIAALPPVNTPPTMTYKAEPAAPTPRYRFDAKRGTVLDNPEDFPPTAA